MARQRFGIARHRIILDPAYQGNMIAGTTSKQAGTRSTASTGNQRAEHQPTRADGQRNAWSTKHHCQGHSHDLGASRTSV
jgi:hypothetical protein